MKPINHVLFEPILTEKSMDFMSDAKTGVYKYAFKVAMDATKDEIAQAIESRFEVKVNSVNTLINRGKWKRVRIQSGKRSNWKKAMIRLQPGFKISEFEGV